VRTMSEHKIELYDSAKHEGLVVGAALLGVDISNCNGGVRHIGYGEVKKDYGPVCILDIAGTPYVTEPHVTWFPWVTAKNRITNFLWAVEEMSKTSEVLLSIQKDQIPFFEHFVKKGILRKIGFINRLPEIDEVHLYQYERHCDVKNS